MTLLHLGVHDVPYTPEGQEAPPKITKKGRVHRTSAKRALRAYQSAALSRSVQTTGDVATQLEEKYGVMQAYVDSAGQALADAVAHGLAGALEDLVMGASITDPFAGAAQEIADGFKTFLSLGVIEDMGVPGVPTRAAIERRSARFKKGAGPARRPSFVDTGAYEGSFTAWFDQD